MGAAGHYIECEGLATTGISLVREHTVGLRPPRALWVSFELGRPLGAPNDTGLQGRVLRAALGLLGRKDGPVILDDFPEDAPRAASEEMEGLVCPAPLPRPAAAFRGPRALLAAEMAALAPWYRLGVEQNRRSTVGVSRLSVEEVADRLVAWLEGGDLQPVPGLSLAQTLRFASEDLRVWYLEAASARPGGGAGASALLAWFWGETAAGALLLALQPMAAASPDPAVRRAAASAFIPRVAQHLIPGAQARLGL